MSEKGMVHLYVGYGKGKTTAAAGLAVRALGRGQRVFFCQFLKNGDSGEVESLRKLGAVTMYPSAQEKFAFEMNSGEITNTRDRYKDYFSKACGLILDGQMDLVILDEVIDAVNAGLIKSEDILSLIEKRPNSVELVMSGHDPTSCIEDAADYYTEFICHAHPFYKGIKAREGVEF